MWLDDLYHALDPVALAAGPVVIRWYGLAYFFGFVCAAIAIRRTARRWGFSMSVDDLTTLMIGIAFGVIIGARLAYVIFYGDGYYLQNPLEVLVPVGGGIRGMSFHGGLVGAIAGGAIACRHLRWSIPTTCDLAVIGAPSASSSDAAPTSSTGSCGARRRASPGASCSGTRAVDTCIVTPPSSTRPFSRVS